MNVLLAEPIEPARDHPLAPPPVPGFPHGSLMCLASHLSARSRHACRVVDLNMHGDPPEALRRAVRSLPLPRLLLVRTGFHNLPEAAALILFARETAPDLRIGCFGAFPTAFPARARELPGVDFVLCGDPEPVMRGLLDFYGMPHRVAKVPGLWIDNPPLVPGPAWLDQMGNRDLAYWTDCWHDDPVTRRAPDSLEMRMRVTRGHTGLACDRAHPEGGRPLVKMDLRELGILFDKFPSLGITSITLQDPPGVWDEATLAEWCQVLETCRNSRKWSITLLPSVLSPETIARMKAAWCGGVDFLFPSCDPGELARYGCVLRPEHLRPSLRRLHDNGITPRAVFWIGGPGEKSGQAGRVYRVLSRLGFPEWSLELFPFHPDSPLAGERSGSDAAPDLAAWLEDALSLREGLAPLAWRAPDPSEPPAAVAADLDRCVRRTPRLIARRVLNALRQVDWVQAVETRLPAWMKSEIR